MKQGLHWASIPSSTLKETKERSLCNKRTWHEITIRYRNYPDHSTFFERNTDIRDVVRTHTGSRAKDGTNRGHSSPGRRLPLWPAIHCFPCNWRKSLDGNLPQNASIQKLFHTRLREFKWRHLDAD